MSDEAAFLRAICADPADDTVRLVYADWLDERGAEGDAARAEFIRVQCQLAAILPIDQCAQCDSVARGGQHTNGPCRCSRKLRDLKRIDRHLLSTDQVPPPSYPRPAGTRVEAWYAWAGPVASLPDPDRQGWTFTRGFVGKVTCSAADWLKHAGAITAAHPIERVRLTSLPELKFEYLGGDQPRFVHLPGRIDKKVVAASHYTPWGNASRCLEAVWPRITFKSPNSA